MLALRVSWVKALLEYPIIECNVDAGSCSFDFYRCFLSFFVFWFELILGIRCFMHARYE